MQSQNRIFDDLARVAGGALGALTSLKDEIEAMIRDRLEPFMADGNFVRREEFDVGRAMAAEARASTMILGALPVFVVAVMSFTSPAYIAPLYTDIRGMMLVGVAVLMLVTGVSIMVKMARFEI
jgi:hypothetical protein